MMDMTRKKNILINAAFCLLIAGGIYLLFKFLLPSLIPFIVGFAVAFGVVKLADRLRPRSKALRALLILLIYGAIGALVALIVVQSVSAGSAVIAWLPELYQEKLLPMSRMLFSWIDQTIASLDPSVKDTVEGISGSLLSSLDSLFSSLTKFMVNLVSGTVKAVPSVFISILVMIVSTFFLSLDFEKITGFLAENTPEKVKTSLSVFKTYLTDTLFVVIRSYLLIMLLTFTELSILFSLFGIEEPIFKAACIAVFDILPLLGTGGILIPWAITSFILGYTALGVKLLVTYVIVAIVRNYAEPKIVGTQLGLHPIITLVSMFIGLRLFGFFGMFGLPVAISFLWKNRKNQKAEP